MPSPDPSTNCNGHQPSTEQEPPQQPVRELTQTDRLNNRLLKSFLEHVNNGDVINQDKTDGEDEDRSAEFED